jgi:antitoxin component YwqK of YwqJK toxin-antitoxin module
MRLALVFALTTVSFLSCKQSSTDYALNWSTDIKTKIFEDINVPVDSTSVDTSKGNLKEVTFYNKGIRTKLLGIRTSTGDTLLSIFYSKDQNFEIVRELCPGNERSFEGIRYKGKHLGIAEFRFCDGKLKEQGFRLDGNVGVWKEWDENGKVIKETDNGHTEKLEELRSIKYYR